MRTYLLCAGLFDLLGTQPVPYRMEGSLSSTTTGVVELSAVLLTDMLSAADCPLRQKALGARRRNMEDDTRRAWRLDSNRGWKEWLRLATCSVFIRLGPNRWHLWYLETVSWSMCTTIARRILNYDSWLQREAEISDRRRTRYQTHINGNTNRVCVLHQ